MIMSTISALKLRIIFTENEANKDTAKKVFGDVQPYIYEIAYYKKPSWNWCYIIGICKKDDIIYEVCTQFGHVVSARELYL